MRGKPEVGPAPAAPLAAGASRPLLPPLGHVLAVAAGGAVGGSLRYGFIQAFPLTPGMFPWVIFLENVTGAFLLGLILTLVLARWRLPWDVRPFLTTGVLGSFTTFSNFSFDLVALGTGGWYSTALGYGVASVGAGLASAAAGMKLGRALAGGRR